jgi:GT2 family glycosyltransferase
LLLIQQPAAIAARGDVHRPLVLLTTQNVSAPCLRNWSADYARQWTSPGSRDPTRLLDIELTEQLPAVSQSHSGRRYRRAVALLRLHRVPIALIPLVLPAAGLAPDELAQAIWALAGAAITAHLRDDGLPEPAGLEGGGLAAPAAAACQVARERFLETAPPVSVVVATRERVDQLAPCLRSLLALDYPLFEVVVVDNAPTSDATRQLVQSLSGEGAPIRYVCEERAGLARAHDRGLKEVDTPLVALTDDDVVVDRDWLTAIAQAFESAGDVACVTGLILPTELETPAQIWFERRARLNKGFRRTIFRRDEQDSDPLFPYTAGRFGSGASMAFDTAALRSVGGFDTASGVGTPARGGDDLIAFFRVVAAGHALVYEPRALLWHAYRGEASRLRRQMFDYGAGLTAYLTSVVLDQPRIALDLVPRLPRAARYALSAKSPRNPGSDFPFERELVWAERLGMGYGPLGYVLSKRRLRKLERSG